MGEDEWLPLRTAWERALYGAGGFYRHAHPREHFRTSVHASALFAQAVVTLVRRRELRAVTDLGAGQGELVRLVHAMAPDLRLTAIELQDRPVDLPGEVAWSHELPTTFDGLLIANEVLDNVACEVVGVDTNGVIRLVEVRQGGQQRLGDEAGDPLKEWLERWWPISRPGERAEVGLARDQFWSASCARIASGVAVAVDYGHDQRHRPALSALRSYRHGRETAVTMDGTRDVTAQVAVDAVAAAVHGQVLRQRDVLGDLGLSGARPDIRLARSDPAGYVQALSRASQAAELMGSPGLGDFSWIISEH